MDGRLKRLINEAMTKIRPEQRLWKKLDMVLDAAINILDSVNDPGVDVSLIMNGMETPAIRVHIPYKEPPSDQGTNP